MLVTGHLYFKHIWFMCECRLTCLKDWQGVKLWIYLPHKAAKIGYESEANSQKKPYLARKVYHGQTQYPKFIRKHWRRVWKMVIMTYQKFKANIFLLKREMRHWALECRQEYWSVLSSAHFFTQMGNQYKIFIEWFFHFPLSLQKR